MFLISASSRPLRLLPFPLDYNFLISSRLSNFMFSTSTHMFWTSRFICFQLRFLYIRLRIRNIRLRIRNIRLRIRNIRLRLKYYRSYFCPQRNAIVLLDFFKFHETGDNRKLKASIFQQQKNDFFILNNERTPIEHPKV